MYTSWESLITSNDTILQSKIGSIVVEKGRFMFLLSDNIHHVTCSESCGSDIYFDPRKIFKDNCDWEHMLIKNIITNEIVAEW